MMRTPLKMKWGKKSGRYELRQDVFVLSVYIGETPLAQCTLTSESTARHCIDYLREKIDLNQVEFFGLRFAMRFGDPDRRQLRWVNMDWPLRKQLEKWACKPRQLQLAILYHTPNVFALHDQMARSIYFMLLKLDVLSGRFQSLDTDRYVQLAAYGLQVEHSDHDPAVHTIDYLRELNLLPEHLCRQAALHDELLARIVAIYETLAGMQAAHAAFLYIVDVQQCDGYGEEHFPAKDDESTDVKLGYSLEEIFVRRYNGSTLKFKWASVRSITSTKRNLIIKCENNAPIVFTMEDVDMAHYVVSVLTWQWTYATTDAIQQRSAPMSIDNLQCGFPRIGQSNLAGSGHSRQSYADVNSIRTTNSVDMSTAAAVTGAVRRPAVASVNRSSSLLETNRFAVSSLFNVNQMNGLQAVTARHPNSATVHSIQSATHPSILNAICSINSDKSVYTRQLYMAPSNSTPSLAVHQISQHSYEPIIGRPTTTASVIYRPARTSGDCHSSEANADCSPSSSAHNEDWLRAEQHTVLKRLLAQHQKNKTIGSSPEIHMLGVAAQACNGHFRSGRVNAVARRVQNVSHNRPPTPALSVTRQRSNEQTPTESDFGIENDDEDSGCGADDSHATTTAPIRDSANNIFCPKWCSTPNLVVENAALGYSMPSIKGGHYYIKQQQTAFATGDLRIITESASANGPDANAAESDLLAPADVTRVESVSGAFSQGHIIASSVTGNNRVIGQPIVYPVPTTNFVGVNVAYDLINQHRLPPIYSTGYGVGGTNSLTASNTSSASSCCHYVVPSLWTAAPAVPAGGTSSTSSTTSSSITSGGVHNLLATPSDESVASTSSSHAVSIANPLAVELLSQHEESTVMAARQRIYRQQNAVNAASGAMRVMSGCGAAYRASAIDDNNNNNNNNKKYNHYNNNNSNNPNNYNNANDSPNKQQQNMSHQQNLERHRSNSAGRNAQRITKSAAMCSTNPCSETTLNNIMLAKLAIPQAVETEFAGVPAKRLSAGHSTSQRPDNQARNRVGKVFPYEDTRVLLQSHRRNLDGYINASYVNMTIGGESVGSRRLRYIVAQAPMRNTVDDFWSMVWDSGVRLIVMLVNPHQIQKATTCPAYWPMKVGEKLHFGHPQAAGNSQTSAGGGIAFRVKLLSSSSSNCQTTSVLSLKLLTKSAGGRRRVVYHLYCADFSEEGIPSSTDAFLGFIDAVNSVRKHIENEERETRAAIAKLRQKQHYSMTNGTRRKKVLAEENSTSLMAENKKSRGRSIARINLLDVTNRLRAHSVEGGNLLRQKFSIGSSHNVSFSSNSSAETKKISPLGGKSQADGSTDQISGDGEVGSRGQTPLTLVHCMDGASESGVFVLVEVILRCIENNTEVEVAQLLRVLRQQRMCLVRSPGQYRFVYELVVAYLQRSRLI